MRIVSSLHTGNYHGYNVKYSPLRPDLLTCATSQNYGIAGQGRLYIINCAVPQALSVLSTTEWNDGLFDVTWSEINEKLLVTSSGDGSIHMWDYLASQTPVAYYRIHSKEVYSVDWSPKNAYPYILSASWDKTLKLWDPFAAKEVLCCVDHTDQLYEAKFCSLDPAIFASVSGDHTLRLWDLRLRGKAIDTIPHGTEVLCCDWSKDNDKILAVGTTDGKIIGWDIKHTTKPIFVLVGHEYAIRRLKFAPYGRGKLASVSYDFTTRFWNWTQPYAVDIHDKHSEFVYGLDFHPSREYEVCDCAWDSLIHVYSGQL